MTLLIRCRESTPKMLLLGERSKAVGGRPAGCAGYGSPCPAANLKYLIRVRSATYRLAIPGFPLKENFSPTTQQTRHAPPPLCRAPHSIPLTRHPPSPSRPSVFTRTATPSSVVLPESESAGCYGAGSSLRPSRTVAEIGPSPLRPLETLAPIRTRAHHTPPRSPL